MHAEEGLLIEKLEGKTTRLLIPKYQREYSWKMKDCETLLFDLLESYKNGLKKHFFGSIVFTTKSQGRLTNHYLIDGQQRISTVILLLMAINNVASDNGYTNVPTEEIKNEYLIDPSTEQIKLKLKMIQGDDEALNSIYLRQTDNYKITNQLLSNYNYFYNKILEMSEEEILGIFNAIKQLEVVFVTLEPTDGDSPQLVFESLNSKGVKLSEADKIRNYLLMNEDSSILDDLYDKFWEPLEIRVEKENLNKFFRYYLAVKTGVLPKEDVLYYGFKEYREKNYSSVEDLMENMNIYSEYYHEIITSSRNDSGYRGVIGRIMYLELNTVIPLLFDFYDAKSEGLLNTSELKEALEILESYYIRRTICLGSSSSLNKTFVSMGNEVRRIVSEKNISYLDALKYTILVRSGKTRFPQNPEFAEKFLTFELYNSKPQFRKMVLERLENYGCKVPDTVINNIDNGTYTIEHIMPQTLTNEWKKYLGQNWDRVHSKYLHTIGNLTITEYNSEYSNLIFDKKCKLPEKGFSFSKIHLNKNLSEIKKWDEKAIVSRGSELFKIAEKLWAEPVTTVKINDNVQILTLDDELNTKDYLFSAYKYNGEDIPCSDFDDAFLKICSTIYGENSSKFAKFKNINLSTKDGKFKKQYSFNSGLFIDMSMKDSGKWEFLKQLVLYMDGDLEDLQFEVRMKDKLDILNPETYKHAAPGEFAQAAFGYLFENELLSDADIQQLLDTGYTRSVFDGSVYAVLSLDKEAGMTVKIDPKTGKQRKTTRYYAIPYEYHGVTYYLSSQWYPYTLNGLISYFNKKKGIK